MPTFKDSPAEALKKYQEVGYHIEPNIMSPERCDALIDAAKHFETDTFRPIMMPHRQQDIFFDAMREPVLVEIMSKLVGGDVSGLQSELFYGKPGTRGFSGHQDNFYVEAEYNTFASAWMALVDVSKENGGLYLCPGSHKEGDLPVRKLALDPDSQQDPNANNEEVVVPEKYGRVIPEVPKGAVVFLHGHVVHGSYENISDSWRYALLNTYIKKGALFRAGNHAKRAEVELIV